MNHGEIFLNLRKELLAMPEYIRLDKIKHFQISLDIFNGNYEDLLNLIETHNTPEIAMELMAENKREIRRAFQIHIIRLLHNYISSAMSLVDHTRVHFNELYDDNNLLPEYKIQVEKRFTSHPLSIFIKDLRQYFQHYRMPSITSSIHFSRENPELSVSVKFEIENLNEFTGWKSKSKEYMSEFEKDIDLKKLVEDYHNHIQNFHSWFSAQQAILHRNDAKKVDAHKKKIRDNELLSFFSLVSNHESIENFEEDLFRFYHQEDLEKIINTTLKKKRLKLILSLLKKESIFSTLYENKIKKLYI